MKAISLTQPWASFMAIEAKRNETRGWPCRFNGDLAICSTKEIWRDRVPDYATVALAALWEFREQFELPFSDANIRDLYLSLPFGAVVCVVEKFDCISINNDNGDDRALTELEIRLGNYGADRFYFPTRNCRRMKSPVPVRGAQGLFTLPPPVEAEVLKQLADVDCPEKNQRKSAESADVPEASRQQRPTSK